MVLGRSYSLGLCVEVTENLPIFLVVLRKIAHVYSYETIVFTALRMFIFAWSLW